MGGDLPFSVVVPTRGCASWCGKFLAEYRRQGVEPLYIVDPRTSDDTVDRLEAAKARFQIFQPRGDFPEAGTLEFAGSAAEKDWVLRIDDDEFPTDQLIDWATQCATGEGDDKAKIWGLSRLNLFHRRGGTFYSRNYSIYDRNQKALILNPQFRFYRKSLVRYKEEIHTPGIVLDVWAYAPPSACILHFDCLLRSASDRIEKVRRYERCKRGFGWTYASQYIPEIFGLDELGAAKFDKDISDFMPHAPSADEGTLCLSFQEIYQLRSADSNHAGHAMRSAFESRNDTASRIARSLPDSLARISVGELVCTLSPVFRPIGLERSVHDLGSAIYERASLRPASVNKREVASSPADHFE